MKYESRLPEEGINTSQTHPLKQALTLAVAALVLIVLLVFVMQISGAALAKKIPFSYETAVMEHLDIKFGNNATHPEVVDYLNELAQRLIQHMPVPDDMDIVVHYNDDQIFNAYATVGGNLMFYKGILSTMPDENTLAMVMAHEISHVLHRDPIASLGGGVVSTLALLGLTGQAGTGIAGSILNNAGIATRVQFTRKMEELADDQAVAAVNALYGHVNGAAALFELFSRQRDRASAAPRWMERFLSTHPMDSDRIENIGQRAATEGWSTDGELVPLPADFESWL
ncbi:MAG: M48 family metallopeptidase [Granulosicoccus sp.]|nr:M48 family metallopeptidase [Granulosicoccus sp.]